MSIYNRPEDSQWGANQNQDNHNREKLSWKRPAATKQPKFLRHPARVTLAFLVDSWKRIEKHWESNPGFFAGSVAGSIGLLLVAAMLFNAGVGWLQDDPIGDDVAADSPDTKSTDAAESDLGDAGGDEIFLAQGRAKKTPREDDREVEGDPGIDSDPFAESPARDKPFTSIDRGEPAEDEPDDSAEMAAPAQIAKVQTPQEADPFDKDDSAAEDAESSEPEPRQETVAVPKQKKNIFEDDDEPEPDEPAAQRPLPEMRVASQPQLPVAQLPADEMTDEEEDATAKAEPAAEPESESLPPEPAKLKPEGQVNIAQADEESSPAIPIKPAKPMEPAKPIESDDTPSKRDRSIDLVRGPAEKAVPQQDPRWQQQRAKSIAESPAPAVVARQSSPVETRIFAAAPVEPPQQAKSTQPAKPVQSARANAVNKGRAPQEKSTVSPLRLTISGPSAVGVGQRCQVEIRVTNTGSVPANRLVVSAELPEGLVHEVSQSLEQQIETLAPGATYRALLRLRGKALGENTIQAEVGMGENAEQAAVQMSAKVRVIPLSEMVTVIGSDDCLCEPLAR